MDTTIYPNNGTSGTPFVHTGGNGHSGIKDLLTNNNIADNTRVVQAAVAAANVSDLNAINLTGVSVIKNVTDGIVSVNKSISDLSAQAALNSAEGRLATAVASGENRLASEISDNVTRGNIASGFTADAIAAKDIQIAVLRDGCATRDAVAVVAAKVAEVCCCIKDDNDKTRALMIALDGGRKDAELADLRMQVLLSKNGGGK